MRKLGDRLAPMSLFQPRRADYPAKVSQLLVVKVVAKSSALSTAQVLRPWLGQLFQTGSRI